MVNVEFVSTETGAVAATLSRTRRRALEQKQVRSLLSALDTHGTSQLHHCASAYSVSQAQISTSTSELRDITKMERIGAPTRSTRDTPQLSL